MSTCPGVLCGAVIALALLAGCPTASPQRGPSDLAGDDLAGTNSTGMSPFTLLPAGPAGGNDIDCTGATTCYVVGALSQSVPVFHRTSDRGQTWPAMPIPGNLGEVAGTSLVSVRFSQTTLTTGYALGYSAGTSVTLYLLGTTDGGVSWSRLPASGLPAAVQVTPAQIELDGATIWVVLRNPPNPLTPMMTYPAAGLYRSTDLGQTFQKIIGESTINQMPPTSLPDYTHLACDGAGTGVCVSGDPTGVMPPIFLFTTNGFATPQASMPLQGLTDGVIAIRYAGNSQFIAIGAKNLFSGTGADWSLVRAVPGTTLQALDCAPSGLCYLGGAAPARLLKGSAGGMFDTPVALPATITSVKRVRIADPTAPVVYLLTDQGVFVGPS